MLQTINVFLEAAPMPAQQTISLWELIKEGGVLMIPLFLCSLLAVYFFAERLIAINKTAVYDPAFMGRIREKIATGDIAGARDVAKSYSGATPKVILKGISRIGRPIDQIEKAMENEGKLSVYEMEKNMGVLSTIAGIAPMIGFLGTIAGMIILFYNVQAQGFNIKSISGGIYTKMMTSATGLVIGLLAYLAYNFLNGRINKAVNRIESASMEFLDTLQEPAK